jgi:aminopeptidase YwaD
MRRLTPLFFIFLMMSCTSFLPTSEDPITENELYNHIKYLSSDSLKGRKPGTPEGRLAAEYIKAEMLKAGFTPLGEDAFQYFDIIADVEISNSSSFQIDDETQSFGEDFTPIAFSKNGNLSTKVVFAGYGFDFSNDSLMWNSYENIDVNNSWALVLRGSPDGKDFGNNVSLRKKVMVATDHGASGVIFVSSISFDEKDALVSQDYAKNEAAVYVPVFHITRDIANSILLQGKTIEALETELNSTYKPSSFAIDKTISANAIINRKSVQTQNVVGVLEGKDSVLKHEYILIGGHYDHLGLGGPGSGSRRPDSSAVHNGADDNASGVSGALEVIERIASKSSALKRSVIFMAFGAEEMGLIGSKYFTNNALIDLSKIKLMINMDMIGRMKDDKTGLTIGGTGTATGLDTLIKDLAIENNLLIRTTKGGYGPSDHASFYTNDISVLFFFTGVTDEYHTPHDDIETINIAGEKIIADFVFDLAVELANKDVFPSFQQAGPKANEQTGNRKFKVTLGIIPEYAGNSDVMGLKVDGVVSGKPAAHAGMDKGDIIIAMDGKSVKDIYEYMNRLSDFKVGQRISVDVMRGNEKVILIVEL